MKAKKQINIQIKQYFEKFLSAIDLKEYTPCPTLQQKMSSPTNETKQPNIEQMNTLPYAKTTDKNNTAEKQPQTSPIVTKGKTPEHTSTVETNRYMYQNKSKGKKRKTKNPYTQKTKSNQP